MKEAPTDLNRRQFIKATGFLTVAFGFGQITCSDGTVLPISPDKSRIDSWLTLLENGHVRVITGKMELGQGIKTAIMQVAAEELNMSMDMMEIQIAETGTTPDEGYTAGSRSVESSAMSVRQAAATARELILKKGREYLETDNVRLENGILVTATRSVPVREVFDEGFPDVNVRGNVPVKQTRNLVGQPVPRRDIEAMVRGESVYVQDLRFGGMLHARMVRPPRLGARLVNIKQDDLSGMYSFAGIVRDKDFLAVLAEHEFEAVRIRNQAVRISEWEGGVSLPRDPLNEYLRNLPSDSNADLDSGNAEEAITGSTIIHEAEYSKPYIMHGSNGPSCAVAFYDDNSLFIWTHSQGVYPLRKSIASMLKLPEESIHIKGVPGSGCYGHNGADDVAAEAGLIATKFPGKHIRLQWMREDEHLWEPYGTAMIMKLRAGLNSSGQISGWDYELWSDGHSTRPGGRPGNLLPGQMIGFESPGAGFRGGAVRNAPPYYDLRNSRVTSHIFTGPLRKSALRSLGAYANIFAIESFMDELAISAGKDPVSFRKDHLTDERALACLEKLREITRSIRNEDRTGLGIAFSRYKNSAAYCAVAVRVHVADDGEVRLLNMWGVIDAGEVINPDGLKNQTEGGMLQSASWTLYEQVEFNSEMVTSADWSSYPVLRFGNIPQMEVIVIDRPDQPPLGAGEAAQGPASAAILNAIFKATGVRIRNLPVRDQLRTPD